RRSGPPAFGSSWGEIDEADTRAGRLHRRSGGRTLQSVALPVLGISHKEAQNSQNFCVFCDFCAYSLFHGRNTEPVECIYQIFRDRVRIATLDLMALQHISNLAVLKNSDRWR